MRGNILLAGVRFGALSAPMNSPLRCAKTWQLPPPATGERRRPPARPQPRTPRATPAARAGPQQRRLVQTAEVAKTDSNVEDGRGSEDGFKRRIGNNVSSLLSCF